MTDRQTLGVAELTPPGRGAIATVAVFGPGAEAAVARHVRGQLSSAGPRLVRFGPPPGEAVVALRRSAEAVELHCHGGRAVVGRILAALANDGAAVRTWTEWLTSTEADPLARDAAIALTAAPTRRTAEILLDQYAGALRAELLRIVGLLGGPLDAAREALAALAGRWPAGRDLTQPWRVAIVGAPNVGKSSLTNALLGYGRALVDSQPGTTRDLVTAPAAFDGWPVDLIDTAGLRPADDPIEAAGVARAREAIASADLLLAVADATAPTTAVALDAEADRVLAVWNKCDAAVPPAAASGLRVSALTGEGIEALSSAIGRRLVPSPPTAGTAVPFTPRQAEALAAARRLLDDGLPQAAIARIEELL